MKIPGITAALETALDCFDFDKKEPKITNPIVAPDPPIQINHCKNISGYSYGMLKLDACAAMLEAIANSQKGLTTDPTRESPCIPKNQKKHIKNIVTSIPAIDPVKKFCIGSNAPVKKVLKSKLNMNLSVPNIIPIRAAGIKAANESDTA